MAYTPIERNRINPVVQSISRFIMRLLGWGVIGGECPVNKAVISAAPHRSNWDLFYTLLSAAASNVPMWFMMKHNLFFCERKQIEVKQLRADNKPAVIKETKSRCVVS